MFALYQVVEGGRECQFLKSVSLAQSLVERLLEEAQTKQPYTESSMPWEISGDELRDRVLRKFVAVSEGRETGEYKLVIDATYTRNDALLFEICHVWGYSDPKWTPLAMRLCTLCEKDRSHGPATPLERFELHADCNKSSDFVHEFLYLQWGHQGGMQKNWGRMGYTNAVLLWPPHLEHLLGKIGFKRAS